MKKIFKLFVILFMIFTIIGIALAIYISATKDNAVTSVQGIDLSVLALSTDAQRENVLLLGVDHNGDINEYKNIRTDTIMIASVDPKSKTAFLLSIPRDTFTDIGGKKDKINHAHSYGGVPNTITSVTNLLGIPIHHYVKADYKAIQEVVDVMGGVDMEVPMDMYYEDPADNPPLVIDLKKGYQHLDGKKAIQLLRFRKGYANQDLGRIQTQQEFIKAVVNNLKNPITITKIPSYIEVFHKNVQTDMSYMDMIKLAAKSINIKTYNIKKDVISGEAGSRGGVSYFFVNESKTAELVNLLISGSFYRDTEPTNDTGGLKTESDTFAKEDTGQKIMIEKEQQEYDIMVLNGGGISGKGKRAGDLLKVNYLEPKTITNADNFNYEDTIIYTNDKELARNIQTILGVGIVEDMEKKYSSQGFEVVIILGKDFIK